MSRSTKNAAATVLDVVDQQTEGDCEPSATDMLAEQPQASNTAPVELTAELPASDAPQAEILEAAHEIEACPAVDGVLDLAPDLAPATEPNLTGDVLGQQLEQLVQSVGIVEELSRRARDTAANDLARYEALLASQQQYAERLDLARGIRDQARTALECAFGQEARAAGESLVGEAERVLQAFAALAEAWQQRASAFLAEHPDVDLLLAERRQQEEHERLWQQLTARARQLESLVANIDDVIVQGLFVESRRLIAVLERDFPEEAATIEQLKHKLAHYVRAEKDTVARHALAQSTEHQARGDFEAAVTTLEHVDVHGLSQDVSEDVFGRWSDACSRLAQSAGAALVRFAPAQGRGLILYPDPAYPNGLLVFSSLGMGPGFPQGKVVTDVAILRRARPFREAAAVPTTSWASFASAAPALAPAAPIPSLEPGGRTRR